jgi:hypothetical protein
VNVHRKGDATTVEAVSPSTSHALDRVLEERRGADEEDWLFVTVIEQEADGSSRATASPG